MVCMVTLVRQLLERMSLAPEDVLPFPRWDSFGNLFRYPSKSPHAKFSVTERDPQVLHG
jgi:hypothetical protein